MGAWARGSMQKFGTPNLFLQPLKLTTSNLVYSWAWGVAYQKQFLEPKLAGVRARGASKIIDTSKTAKITKKVILLSSTLTFRRCANG